MIQAALSSDGPCDVTHDLYDVTHRSCDVTHSPRDVTRLGGHQQLRISTVIPHLLSVLYLP